MDIDDLLERSAPPTTPPTSDLTDELVALRLRAEGEVRGRRRPRRAVVVAGGLAAVLGLGGVATAAGWVPGIGSFTSASGSSCRVDFRVNLVAPLDIPQPTASEAEQRRTLAAARESLARLDIAAIDRPDAIESFTAATNRVNALQPDPAERAPLPTGDELEQHAMYYAIGEHLRADLASQGLDLQAIATSMGSRCDR